ncbi:chemotaxis protein CheD [Brevundimonas sp. Root1423]|uniref:chemotaxis protein CheD n=1 Tax=Brevundimonas sp. Root1423 TaxID=1736462 RepID=UPI0006F5F5E7|nr:chemotaxis protein CheD [Brevundimonas sp. Root1423]KQY85032.1 chemotaxis protein CheD [Brevundimonas sp. Root1423]
MTAAATLDTVRRIHVGQGEHFVTDDPGVMLTTILGSCVAMCLRDSGARIGGMNHFLLPEGAGSGADAGRRYGAYAMEVLINDCLKRGARRDRLEAKLFGGGRMFDSLRDVGLANADFAERFLRDEGIALVGGSLRGSGGRRVQYWPATGRALQRAVTDRAAPEAVRVPQTAVEAGALELF